VPAEPMISGIPALMARVTETAGVFTSTRSILDSTT
jgi:hypothetical protein